MSGSVIGPEGGGYVRINIVATHQSGWHRVSLKPESLLHGPPSVRTWSKCHAGGFVSFRGKL